MQANPHSSATKIIEVSEYDSSWPISFLAEELLIKESLGALCLNVLHVGSTSVPGLLAKPIIDMILVIPKETNTQILDEALTLVGYGFKGYYNLPFRRMYAKRGTLKFNLHVHEVGRAEIDLNIKFRDYLRAHPNACLEYAKLKKSILNEDPHHVKSANGIPTYNLNKNAFILSILDKANFTGTCLRFCTPNIEWEAYHQIKKLTLEAKQEGSFITQHSSHLADSTKHFVLSKGTKIVAAAAIELDLSHATIQFVGSNIDAPSEKNTIISELRELLEVWLKRNGYSKA
jgi:GrpB-like predicted nucleotidyltransferase (UPF0157 family)